ncbi:MAG: M48 family metallopeptidase [Candidatus Pacebacteria bacterium]|nr:M48 family metallopeptidase [Candidatus Paceibacterota bacterium]
MATTLYREAESNVRKTFFLIFFFSIFLILLGWLFSYLLHSQFFLYLAVIISLITSVSSYWFSDKIVLATTGAMPIEKEDEPELYRLVENFCITTGLPMPKIYILNEDQPNAFATGRDEKHAILAVTKGLLQRLSRVEMEGVLAHELSHIRNKDMLLQTVIVVLVGSIAIVSNFFFRISFWGGGRRNDREANPVVAVLGIVAAILAPIAATLLQLAISRQREFLADASGALITRYPEGLASALEKIASDNHPMERANNSVAHLFISSPMKGEEATSWFAKLFMTHPPIEERIAALRGMRLPPAGSEGIEKEVFTK